MSSQRGQIFFRKCQGEPLELNKLLKPNFRLRRTRQIEETKERLKPLKAELKRLGRDSTLIAKKFLIKNLQKELPLQRCLKMNQIIISQTSTKDTFCYEFSKRLVTDERRTEWKYQKWLEKQVFLLDAVIDIESYFPRFSAPRGVLFDQLFSKCESLSF